MQRVHSFHQQFCMEGGHQPKKVHLANLSSFLDLLLLHRALSFLIRNEGPISKLGVWEQGSMTNFGNQWGTQRRIKWDEQVCKQLTRTEKDPDSEEFVQKKTRWSVWMGGPEAWESPLRLSETQWHMRPVNMRREVLVAGHYSATFHK